MPKGSAETDPKETIVNRIARTARRTAATAVLAPMGRVAATTAVLVAALGAAAIPTGAGDDPWVSVGAAAPSDDPWVSAPATTLQDDPWV
ncbi:hypothetical protein AB0D46_28375 [Streptomyces sp. NPDC048383]|uniref:hypothetical protein n=1 Tax=Streptomyces sp. NPDC048383 TaxID=3155386 RepID=UPI0034308251